MIDMKMLRCQHTSGRKLNRSLSEWLAACDTSWDTGISLLPELPGARKPIGHVCSGWRPAESVQHDILELLHRKRKESSDIFCSQHDSNCWHGQLGIDDSPLSEAILAHIKHNAHKNNIIPPDSVNHRSMREVYGLVPVLSEQTCRRGVP